MHFDLGPPVPAHFQPGVPVFVLPASVTGPQARFDNFDRERALGQPPQAFACRRIVQHRTNERTRLIGLDNEKIAGGCARTM